LEPAVHPVSVLLVEDDADFAALVRRCVAGLSGAPGLRSAGTLAEALEGLRSTGFDLVLADLGLPDSSGLDTLQRIAAATSSPIIVLTAADDPGIREAALAAGAYEFVQKQDFDSRVLARLVRLAAMQARTFRSLRESEARFRSLTQLSSDWYWEQDSEFRLTFMSSRMGERTGLAAAPYLGRRRWEVQALNLTEADWQRHRESLERHEPFRDFEMERSSEDGSSVWLSISGEPVYDHEGRFTGYRGVGRDITARKRAAELQELEHKVTRSLAEAETTAAGAGAVLRAICETLGWECGRYFEVDEQAGVLRFAAAWGRPERAVEQFIEISRRLIYRRGEGLSGHVWQTGEPLWVSDVGADARASGSSRRATGRAALQGGSFVFPVIAGGATLGIASFSSDGRKAPGARLLEALGVIVSQLGQFLQRKHAESTHLRYQQCIAGFGQSVLSCRDAQELAEEAVQQVLAALGADSIAYIERGREPGQLFARAAAGAEVPALRTAADGDPVPGVLESGMRYAAERCSLPFEGAQPAAAAIVPVAGDEGVRGALCAVSRLRHFAAEELNFLDAIASVLSAGLRRLASEERLAFLAQFDSLTGLPNRTLLADRFAQMIEQTRRRELSLGVLFIDLDDFKSVNDTLGHAAGDDLLAEVARRLEQSVRPGDTVARISGDEFALVIADLRRQEDAALVAQKLVERLAAPFEITGHEVVVTASVGIACYPADGQDVETLLGAADAAMYRAKQSGRNAFQFFTHEINQRTKARALLGAELRRALERGEFRLAYQPKYDLVSMGPSGAEALLRWDHPERGFVPPAQFVHVLEESGLIVAVGEWALKQACADLKACVAAGVRPLPVAVNLSARQFRQRDLGARIRALVGAAGVTPDLIELEITESHLMHDPAHAIHVMRKLRDEGIRIALDDFGTGYSSLAYLTRFPVAALKIDRSFVAGIGRESSDPAIVRTIIEMARTLDFTVIAEGVETEAQVRFLRRFGCHQAQGYYFARPMSIEGFIALIGSGTIAPPRKTATGR
jgi:diguanylate cyclase (GGDEF)-like protein/PAS domain S-box-containing protein